MGRWSRLLAPRFVSWLSVRPAADWLDVGCGTGALADAIRAGANPASVVACDPSAPFIAGHRADSAVRKQGNDFATEVDLAIERQVVKALTEGTGIGVHGEEFGGPGACDGVAAPRAELQAHAAPLGLAFYPDANSVVIAVHGSWNRSVPVPPHLVRVLLQPDGQSVVEDFATGWQLGVGSDTRWGRVAGVVVGPDGSLYVSDDAAGAIYRLSR